MVLVDVPVDLARIVVRPRATRVLAKQPEQAGVARTLHDVAVDGRIEITKEEQFLLDDWTAEVDVSVVAFLMQNFSTLADAKIIGLFPRRFEPLGLGISGHRAVEIVSARLSNN